MLIELLNQQGYNLFQMLHSTRRLLLLQKHSELRRWKKW